MPVEFVLQVETFMLLNEADTLMSDEFFSFKLEPLCFSMIKISLFIHIGTEALLLLEFTILC